MHNTFKLQAFLAVAVMVTAVPFVQAVPETINYQGKIEVDGAFFTGTGQFMFAIVDDSGIYRWSNDAMYPPATAVDVPVENGLYHVILGELPGMQPIPASLFDSFESLSLRIWFNDGANGLQQLSPDQPLSSVGYALKADLARDADTVDGAEAADLEESAEIDADIAAHAALPSAHHVKTTLFSELMDTATDAQIPDDITVNYAAAAGDAGTLDGVDSTQFLRNDQDGTLNGNLTVNGSVQADGFTLTAAPADGYVLTSDAAGNGSWQPGGGGSGSGGSLEYPDGFAGMTPVTAAGLLATPYTVPAGKNLYISNAYAGNNRTLYVNGAIVLIGYFNTGSVGDSDNRLGQPVAAGPGDSASANNDDLVINGILVDAGVTPVTRNNLFSSAYKVPAGKILVILNAYANLNYLYIDGNIVLRGYYTTGQVGGRMQHLSQPLFAAGGQVISAADNAVTVNGYLVDAQ